VYQLHGYHAGEYPFASRWIRLYARGSGRGNLAYVFRLQAAATQLANLSPTIIHTQTSHIICVFPSWDLYSSPRTSLLRDSRLVRTTLSNIQGVYSLGCGPRWSSQCVSTVGIGHPDEARNRGGVYPSLPTTWICRSDSREYSLYPMLRWPSSTKPMPKYNPSHMPMHLAPPCLH
jgi:hypothetical protein